MCTGCAVEPVEPTDSAHDDALCASDEVNTAGIEGNGRNESRTMMLAPVVLHALLHTDVRWWINLLAAVIAIRRGHDLSP